MNLYQPHLMRIEEIVDETHRHPHASAGLPGPGGRRSVRLPAGQFGEYSVFGAGECTFCIASSPTRKGYIECSFKAVGKVTKALRRLGVGDTMGFRGPYGNPFPLDRMKGRASSSSPAASASPPVRCVIWNVLDLRDRVQGRDDRLRRPQPSATWSTSASSRSGPRRADVKLWQTVDPGGETPDWTGEVGFVPADRREGGARRRGRLRRRLRPADHDQVHAAGAGQARLRRRTASTPRSRTG